MILKLMRIWLVFVQYYHSEVFIQDTQLQGVPLATEPGIFLIILPLMRILQRDLKRIFLIV
jgi:hypothetical protein